MRTAAAKRRASQGALTVFVALVSACGILDAPPGHQVNLSDEPWIVLSVDGQMLVDETPTVKFNGAVVEVEVSCGTFSGQLVRDTDGAAMSLGPFDAPPPACNDASDEVETVLSALEGVETWKVESEDLIELEGSQSLTLARRP